MPLSRTHTYKKITKPLLERKRRARINKCLDELKDIMTGDYWVAIVTINNVAPPNSSVPFIEMGKVALETNEF